MVDVMDGRVVEAVGWGLVHSVWELAVVALLVWGILRAVPRMMARVRYGVGLLAMGVMVVCVVGTVWEYLPAGGEGRPVVGRAADGERLLLLDHPQTLAEQQVVGNVGTISVEAKGTERRVLWWVVWGYLAGVAVGYLRLVGMWVGMVRIGHGATIAREGVQRWARELALRMKMGMVRVAESARVEVPMVVGVLRPVVVVPVMAVTGLSERELMALLAHEMAHVRRWDPVVNALQCVVEAVLFYHPAVWWMSRVIREERECCCDDVAVGVVGDRAGYAGALAAMEGMRAAGGRLAIGAGSGTLVGRVERLLAKQRELHAGRGWAVVTCVMAAVAVGMGAWVAGCAGGRAGRAAEKIVGDGEVVERVYDVSDMLVPRGTAELVMPPAGREDGAWKGNFIAAANDRTMAEIKETVETVVSPDSWKDKGGKVGEMVLKPGGMIAVTQTGANQRAVKALMEQLRETRGLRIGLKCELLVMSKEAYDAFGADRVTVPDPLRQGLSGQQEWNGKIVDGYQWAQLMNAAGEKAVAGRAETEVLNGQVLGVRLAGKEVPGGVRMAVQGTASADRRYVVLTLRTAAGPGESNPAVRTLFSVPEKSATLCMSLGKVATSGGEEKYGVWAMRAGIVEGAAKMERGWGFGEEGSDVSGAGRGGSPAVRGDVLAAQERERARNARTQEMLGREIDVVAHGQMTLKDALERVQNASGVNVLVNWREVEAAGISRTMPIPVNLRRVPGEKALKEILNKAGGATVALGYRIQDGVVTVSTRDDLESSQYQTIQVYDLRDFLAVAKMPEGAPALPEGDAGWKQFPKEEVAAREKQILKEIVDTLETIVAPQSWIDKGVKIGSVREVSGQLIVTQTEENQLEVKRLLGQLREMLAVQVSVEAVALAVTEERFAALAKTYVGLNEGKVVTVGGEEALKALLAEVEGDEGTVESTMPRVTVFNGHGVGITGEATSRGKAAGAKGFVLGATATVTVDRKGVVMDLKCGAPEVIGQAQGKWVEKDLRMAVADRIAAAVYGGSVTDKDGVVREVVWVVRPAVIVLRGEGQ